MFLGSLVMDEASIMNLLTTAPPMAASRVEESSAIAIEDDTKRPKIR